jgi:hypothetical protein
MKKILILGVTFYELFNAVCYSGDSREAQDEYFRAQALKAQVEIDQAFMNDRKIKAETEKLEFENQQKHENAPIEKYRAYAGLINDCAHALVTIVGGCANGVDYLFKRPDIISKLDAELLSKPWATGKDCSLGVCIPYHIGIESVKLKPGKANKDQKAQEILAFAEQRALYNLIIDVTVFNRFPYPLNRQSGNTGGFRFKATSSYLQKLMPFEEHSWQTWGPGCLLDPRLLSNLFYSQKIHARYFRIPAYQGALTYSCLDMSGKARATYTVDFAEGQEICLSCDTLSSMLNDSKKNASIK